MTVLYSYVCRGARPTHAGEIMGASCGAGWWGEVVPDACPHCGRPIYVTQHVKSFDVRGNQ